MFLEHKLLHRLNQLNSAPKKEQFPRLVCEICFDFLSSLLPATPEISLLLLDKLADFQASLCVPWVYRLPPSYLSPLPPLILRAPLGWNFSMCAVNEVSSFEN